MKMKMRTVVAVVVGVAIGMGLVGVTGWAAQQNGIALERAVVKATAVARAQGAATAQAIQTRQAGATATAQAERAATAVARWYAEGTATAEAAATGGVHVCSAQHYRSVLVSCAQDDTQIADSGSSYVVWYGPGGGNFTSARLTFLVYREQGDGTYRGVGSFTDDQTSLSAPREEFTLAQILSYAGVTPGNLDTYEIRVQQPDVSLGSATFTYVGS